MKIYPSKHEIVETDGITDEHISLGYIDHAASYEVSIIPNKEFMKESKQQIMAYDEFDDQDMFLYDSNLNLLSDIPLKRLGNRYIYEPSGAIEFTPQRFSCSVVVKKTQPYRNDTHYDIRAAVIGDDNNFSVCNKLITVFGDAYVRGTCPPNIQVNGGSISPASLVDASIKQTDFLFSVGNLSKEKITACLDNQTNVWISTDTFGKIMKDPVEIKTSSETSQEKKEMMFTDLTPDNFDSSSIKEETATTSSIINQTKLSYTTRKITVKKTPAEITEEQTEGGMLKVTVTYNVTTTITESITYILNYTSPMLYASSTYAQNADTKIRMMDTSAVNDDFPKSEYKYEFVCENVLILERINGGGFIIVTPSYFIQDFKDNVRLIYEIMMKCYLSSCFKSNTLSSWITDRPVDYIYYHTNRYGVRHAKLNLESTLREEGLIGNYQILSVTVDNDNVFFAGLDKDTNLLFYKKGTSIQDPTIPADCFSFLTTKGTIVYYKPEDINIMVKALDIQSSIDKDNIFVIVYPIVNSQMKLNTKDKITLKIKDNSLDYCLCAKQMPAKSNTELSLVPRKEYNEQDNGLMLAYIEIYDNADLTIYDTRVKGGGASKNSSSNYELIDVGNIYGRPYRIGSTLIFHLPKELKKYKDRIESEVEKHIASGDYPVFLYDKEGALI